MHPAVSPEEPGPAKEEEDPQAIPASSGSASAEDDDDPSDDDLDDAPRSVGGIPAMPLLVGLVVVMSVSIYLISVIPLTLTVRKTGQLIIDEEHELVMNVVRTQTKGYFSTAQSVPWSIPQYLTLENDATLVDRDFALPFLTALLAACSPTCIVVYYGVNNTANDFFLLERYPNGSHAFDWRSPTAPHYRQRAWVDDLRSPSPTLGPSYSTGVRYIPKDRPWWPILERSRQWVSIYQDFNSVRYATTTGMPVRSDTGALRAVAAVDIDFKPLLDDLNFGGEPDSHDHHHGVVFTSAPSDKLIFRTWTSAQPGLESLRNVSHPQMRTGLDALSYSELHGQGNVTKEVKGVFVKSSVSSMTVAADTGLELRFVLYTHADEVRSELRRWVFFSLFAGGIATLIVIVGVTLVVVFAFARPLSRVSAGIEANTLAVLRGEDVGTVGDAEPEKPVLRELREIEQSFSDLKGELRRIRGFIPDGCFLDDDAASLSRISSLASISTGPSMTRFGVVCEDASVSRDRQIIPVQSADSGNPMIAVSGEGKAQDADDDNDDDLSSISSIGSPSKTPTPSGSRASSRQQNLDARLRTSGISAKMMSSVRSSIPKRGAATAHFLMSGPISFLDVEVRQFLSHVEKLPQPAKTAVSLCDAVAGIISSAAVAFGGSVNHFKGDSATMSFNTARPNLSHKRSCIHAAVAISQMVRLLRVDSAEMVVGFLKQPRYPIVIPKNSHGVVLPTNLEDTPDSKAVAPFPNGISAGAASGRGLFGNVGAHGLTRFCVFSEAVFVAESQARKCAANSGGGGALPLQCLAGGHFANDISHTVAFMYVDHSRAHSHEAEGAKRTILTLAPMRMLMDSVANHPDDGNDSEWMYELERAEKANEFRLINAAFLALQRGDDPGASVALDEAQQHPEAAKAAIGIRRLQNLLGQSGSQHRSVPSRSLSHNATPQGTPLLAVRE